MEIQAVMGTSVYICHLKTDVNVEVSQKGHCTLFEFEGVQLSDLMTIVIIFYRHSFNSL